MKHRFLREYFSWSNKYLFCWCEWHLREHFREKMLPIAIYTFKYLYSNLVHLPMYFFLIYPAGEESGWISLKTAPCIWRQTVYFWIKVIICRVQKRILKDRHPGWQGAIFNYCSLNKQFPVERSGKEQGQNRVIIAENRFGWNYFSWYRFPEQRSIRPKADMKKIVGGRLWKDTLSR